MTKILVTYDMFRDGFAELEERYEVTFPEGRDFTYQEVLELIPAYDGLCSMFNFPVNQALLEKASNLKIVANYAVGYDNIDVAFCTQKGIAVANTPDSVIAPTANLALGLLLDVARRITECDRKFRNEGISMKVDVSMYQGVSITGKTLGIIGMGRIGKALARRAIACGMHVIYHNRRPLSKEEELSFPATYVTKEELLRQSDFVSLNAPFYAETHHIIGANELAMMKPTAILINTARGPLIDELALVRALKEGQIYGAGLDMFEFGDHPSPDLLEMEKVVLTPHLGTQTKETRLEMAKAVADNVIGFFEGDRPVTRVYTK